MIISTITYIGENVWFVGEGLLADPHGTLTTHMRNGVGLHRVEHDGHTMSTNAGEGTASIDYLSRATMGATGTK